MISSALMILFALGVFSLPVIPALRELRRPSDCAPLDVFAGNAADTRAYLDKAMALRKADASMPPAEVLRLSEVWVGPSFQEFSAENAATARAIWATEPQVLRPGSISPDALKHVATVHAPSLVVASDCLAEVALSADQSIQLQEGAFARKLCAPRIEVGVADPEKTIEVEGTSSVPLTGATWKDVPQWWHHPGNLAFSLEQGAPKGATRVDGDIVVAGDLTLGDDITVIGSIKTGGTLTLGRGCQVTGNCIGTDVVVGAQSVIGGNVIGDNTVVIGQAAQIGSTNSAASVIGTQVALKNQCSVYGAVVAHQQILATS